VRRACWSLLIALPVSVVGQTFRGGINGTVIDQSGAVVAGAALEAVDVAIRVGHKAVTSSGGEYGVQDLPLCSYKVTVEATGFKPEAVTKVPVAAGVIYMPRCAAQLPQATSRFRRPTVSWGFSGRSFSRISINSSYSEDAFSSSPVPAAPARVPARRTRIRHRT